MERRRAASGSECPRARAGVTRPLLQGSPQSQVHPMNPLRIQHARAFHDRFDGLLKKALANADPARPPTCQRGCFFCCKENVLVERGEAELIVERVNAMPEADRAAV